MGSFQPVDFHQSLAEDACALDFRAIWLITSFDILPSYNVAPQSFPPVVRLNDGTGEREFAQMRWGLVPFWAKDPKIAYSTLNAKAETVATSPTFREALKRRRCLVPADGFYEWQWIDAKTKQRCAIAVKGERGGRTRLEQFTCLMCANGVNFAPVLQSILKSRK